MNKQRQHQLLLFLSYLLTTSSATHLRHRRLEDPQTASAIPTNSTANTTLSELESNVSEIQSELESLISEDDSLLTDEEFESKMEEEEELLNEEFELDEEIDELQGEGSDNSELDEVEADSEMLGSGDGGNEKADVQAAVVGKESEGDADDLVGEGGWDDLVGELDEGDLEEELEEVQEEIEELEAEDDDGQDAYIKEALVEELEDIEEDIEEVIEEEGELGDDDGYEVYSPSEGVAKANITAAGLSSVTLGGKDSLPNIDIDPTLTMDLTQYNTPPKLGDAETKEATSEASVMESEADRHGINGTLPEEVVVEESINEEDDDDDYVPPSKSQGISSENAVVADDDVDDDNYVEPNKSTIVAEETSNKTLTTLEDEADGTMLPSLESESEVAKEDEDDDDYVPPSTAESKESDEKAVAESTSESHTTEVEGEDNLVEESKEDALSEEGMPPTHANITAFPSEISQKNTTAFQILEGVAESEPKENDDSFGSELSAESNSTETAPSESVETDDGLNESEVAAKANLTEPEPVDEEQETTTASNNTSLSEYDDKDVKIETATTTAATTTETITKPALVESTRESPAPSPEPTYSPTNAKYESTDDALDPVMNEQNIIDNEAFSNGEVSTPATGGGRDIDDFLREEEEEVKKVGGWMGFAAIILAVWTAYQMSENPDGMCASICRLVITVLGCAVKIILMPFKYLFGGGRGSSGGHYMSTPSYRDPYGSRHLELT